MNTMLISDQDRLKSILNRIWLRIKQSDYVNEKERKLKTNGGIKLLEDLAPFGITPVQEIKIQNKDCLSYLRNIYHPFVKSKDPEIKEALSDTRNYVDIDLLCRCRNNKKGKKGNFFNGLLDKDGYFSVEELSNDYRNCLISGERLIQLSRNGFISPLKLLDFIPNNREEKKSISTQWKSKLSSQPDVQNDNIYKSAEDKILTIERLIQDVYTPTFIAEQLNDNKIDEQFVLKIINRMLIRYR